MAAMMAPASYHQKTFKLPCNQQESSSFFYLPPEVRNNIYQHILLADGPLRPKHSVTMKPHPRGRRNFRDQHSNSKCGCAQCNHEKAYETQCGLSLQLLSCCQRLFVETSGILYGENVVQVDLWYSGLHHLYCVESLRDVQVDNCYCYDEYDVDREECMVSIGCTWLDRMKEDKETIARVTFSILRDWTRGGSLRSLLYDRQALPTLAISRFSELFVTIQEGTAEEMYLQAQVVSEIVRDKAVRVLIRRMKHSSRKPADLVAILQGWWCSQIKFHALPESGVAKAKDVILGQHHVHDLADSLTSLLSILDPDYNCGMAWRLSDFFETYWYENLDMNTAATVLRIWEHVFAFDVAAFKRDLVSFIQDVESDLEEHCCCQLDMPSDTKWNTFKRSLKKRNYSQEVLDLYARHSARVGHWDQLSMLDFMTSIKDIASDEQIEDCKEFINAVLADEDDQEQWITELGEDCDVTMQSLRNVLASLE